MFKAFFGKKFAAYAVKKIQKWSHNPIEAQQQVFKNLLAKGQNTAFGKAHDFHAVKSYEDFRQAVPIRDYETFKPYLDRVIAGEKDIIWPGQPLYFAKTSGTTSGGAKYLPITNDSVPNHIHSARNALCAYMHESGNNDFLRRKLMFLSGSPKLYKMNGIKTGRLSGIVNHHVPFYLQTSQLPSFATNCIENWEEKLTKVIEETEHQDLGLISGIPPWVQMYFEQLSDRHGGKPIKDIFPNLSVFAHGGVNYAPYRDKINTLIGKEIDTIENYPASEGFIAFQDKFPSEGLLLVIHAGIFYEFVPLTEIHKENPPRYKLDEVEKGVNYAVIVTNNAGLWGYNLGDTVRFVSTNPYRIVVTGRVKQFISAFGEHVIIEEVEQSMTEITHETGVSVRDFSVAPLVTPAEGLPHHQWFIEFESIPEYLDDFRMKLDKCLQEKNIYYKDLVQSGILQPLQIVTLRENGFNDYLKSIGKLGGQYKVPRLRNDREVADDISAFVDKSHSVNKAYLNQHAGK